MNTVKLVKRVEMDQYKAPTDLSENLLREALLTVFLLAALIAVAVMLTGCAGLNIARL